MKESLLVYYSKNNTTESTVNKIKKVKDEAVNIVDLAQGSVSADGYKKVFIGCGIYAGHMPKQIVKFVKDNKDSLANKKVVIFIHGLISDNNYSDIVKNDIGKYVSLDKILYLGGQVDINKQNFIVRKMLVVIAKKNNFDPYNNCNINEDKILELINLI